MTVTMKDIQAQLKAKSAVQKDLAKTVPFMQRMKADTTSAFEKAGKAIHNITPVIQKEYKRDKADFLGLVAELNDKHNDHDREIWKGQVMTHMIAQKVGVNLPGDEELNALYDQYQADLAAEEEAKAKAAVEAKAEEMKKLVLGVDPTAHALEKLTSILLGVLQPQTKEEPKKEEVKVELPAEPVTPSAKDVILKELEGIKDPATRKLIEDLVAGKGPVQDLEFEDVVEFEEPKVEEAPVEEAPAPKKEKPAPKDKKPGTRKKLRKEILIEQ